MAAFAFAACDPDEKSATEFKAENIIDTKWTGTLKTIDGTVVKGTADVKIHAEKKRFRFKGFV